MTNRIKSFYESTGYHYGGRCRICRGWSGCGRICYNKCFAHRPNQYDLFFYRKSECETSAGKWSSFRRSESRSTGFRTCWKTGS